MKITNPKIEKQKAEIGKTKAKIAEHQAKLREQEKTLRSLEDLEIVAQFRSERMSDEHLDIIKTDAKDRPRGALETPADTDVSSNLIKEEPRNANTENQ